MINCQTLLPYFLEKRPTKGLKPRALITNQSSHQNKNNGRHGKYRLPYMIISPQNKN